MASVAKLGLRLDQHEIYVGGFVRAVTACAADAVGQVLGLREVLGFEAGLVTLRANCCRLGWAQGFEADDLGDVAAAIDMRLPGTVTSLASVLVALQKRRMRSSCKVFIPDFLVAGLADIGWRVLLP